MNKLNKTQLKERGEHVDAVREGQQKLSEAVDAFNAKRSELYETLAEAVTVYNDELSVAFSELEEAAKEFDEKLQGARDWRDQMTSDLDEYIGERSDKWQESDKGQEVTSWREAFDIDLETITFEAPDYVEVAEPDDLEVEMEDQADALEQIPEEAGS